MSNVIEFFCDQDDMPLEIQLEPEAIIFVASPGNAIKFVAINTNNNFKWAIRVGSEDRAIQLLPDTLGHYDIEVYENNTLITDFY